MDIKGLYRAEAEKFLKEYKISSLTLEQLTDIFSSQGYKIIRYNTFEEKESVMNLLNELNLVRYAKENVAFTYRDGNIKLVFVDDSILDKDKLYALLHEEGHIYCGHMDRCICSSANVEDEREANEFAHYVLHPTLFWHIGNLIKCYKKQILITVFIIVLVLLGAFTAQNIMRVKLGINEDYVKTMDYYVTSTGYRYHAEGCKYIEGKTGIRRITEDEFNSGKYQPCKECIEKKED